MQGVQGISPSNQWWSSSQPYLVNPEKFDQNFKNHHRITCEQQQLEVCRSRLESPMAAEKMMPLLVVTSRLPYHAYPDCQQLCMTRAKFSYSQARWHFLHSRKPFFCRNSLIFLRRRLKTPTLGRNRDCVPDQRRRLMEDSPHVGSATDDGSRRPSNTANQ